MMTIMGRPGILPAVSVLMLMLVLGVPAHAQYAGGSGTADDPYQIATAEDLVLLGQTPADYDKHFVLTADIDLDPNLPGRKIFGSAVIAPDADRDAEHYQGTPFTGGFDGAGHTISDLTIDGDSYLGLFGQLETGALVQHLGLVDVDVIGSGRFVGALAGANAGQVRASYATGAVTGDESAAGFIGWHMEGTVTDAYSACRVTGGSILGGFIGTIGVPGESPDAADGPSVLNCYSVGVVLGEGLSGGFAGEGQFPLGSLSFWDVQTSEQSDSAYGTGLTTAQMQTAGTFLDAGWDLLGEAINGTDDIWWIFDGKDYPRLWWQQVLADDFEDGQRDSRWLAFQPDPSSAWVTEKDGRLEVHTSVFADDVDAGYISNGWRLDPSNDFALRVDFRHAKRSTGDSWAMVALLPSFGAQITKILMFGAGCDMHSPYFFYEQVDGYQRFADSENRSLDEGTLFVSYDAATDELYLSHTGYGEANAWQTIGGLLKGTRWRGEPVYVAIAGGADGVALESDDVWLDNFVLNRGTVVQSDEDADSDD